MEVFIRVNPYICQRSDWAALKPSYVSRWIAEVLFIMNDKVERCLLSDSLIEEQHLRNMSNFWMQGHRQWRQTFTYQTFIILGILKKVSHFQHR